MAQLTCFCDVKQQELQKGFRKVLSWSSSKPMKSKTQNPWSNAKWQSPQPSANTGHSSTMSQTLSFSALQKFPESFMRLQLAARRAQGPTIKVRCYTPTTVSYQREPDNIPFTWAHVFSMSRWGKTKQLRPVWDMWEVHRNAFATIMRLDLHRVSKEN